VPFGVQSTRRFTLLDFESDNADAQNESVKKFCEGVRKYLDQIAVVVVGQNPDVFWFKIERDGSTREVVCQICFYGAASRYLR